MIDAFDHSDGYKCTGKIQVPRVSAESMSDAAPLDHSVPVRVDYSRVFTQAIDRLHAEGRYRVFIDILRNKGSFPNARCFAGITGRSRSPCGARTTISQWASIPR